ncbi:MAG: FCD domain-containing protein [Pseudomonadota bacterium]
MSREVPKPNVRETSQRKAEEIVAHVRARIDTGEWTAGSRIPTEKALIAQFAAARNTVRKALAQLESSGAIERHVGRGTFVRGGRESSAAPAARVDLADVSPAEVNEIRVVLEPSVAELVVARATQSEIARARECYENTLYANSLEEYEHWDAELHSVILRAARNSVLGRIYEVINEVRQRPEWHEIKRSSLTQERRQLYNQHHAAIVEALSQRDAVALRRALREHLLAVSSNMLHPQL